MTETQKQTAMGSAQPLGLRLAPLLVVVLARPLAPVLVRWSVRAAATYGHNTCKNRNKPWKRPRKAPASR